MKLQLNPLATILVFLVTFVIISATGKEEKYGHYSTVYNDNEYIVLKRNHVSDSKKFAPNSEYGKLIPDSVADAEIKLYRDKYPDATRYIDFNFNNLLGYIASFQNVENVLDNRNLGIRIYPAIDLNTNQLTVIISPTRNDRALWKNSNATNGRTVATDSVQAFNTGSLCPYNCPE